MSLRRTPFAARRRGRTLASWLAVLALVIQSALPLADAALHAALGGPPDDDLVQLAAAPQDGGGAVTTIAKPAPAHLAHACPICQFLAALGSFAPPTAARTAAPASVDRFAVWPTAPPVVRPYDLSAAQPRAPPVVI